MRRVLAQRTGLSAALAIVLWAMTASVASADSVARGSAAFHRGDYVRAARELAPAAERGNARALGMLGFLYEHGFGVPQAYAAAADCYYRGAVQGDPFAQAQLGLMYDKGHGVPTDFVLAYKWLNLAAARSNGRQRDAYLRFRDAVASKLSTYEIIAGQRFALEWAPDRPAPDVHLTAK
ncbi:TPR repeat protein [Bradyrhizobium sp. USDA 4541]|nr:TPR repeat protein [Bradyrhizobium sp. USDA 4541]MCP1912222.1 TPR repeat protein [Bradyrhizobium elkanii]